MDALGLLRGDGGLRGEDGVHGDVAPLQLPLEGGLISCPPPFVLAAALARKLSGPSALRQPLQLGYAWRRAKRACYGNSPVLDVKYPVLS